jgi:hypothetical protein
LQCQRTHRGINLALSTGLSTSKQRAVSVEADSKKNPTGLRPRKEIPAQVTFINIAAL